VQNIVLFEELIRTGKKVRVRVEEELTEVGPKAAQRSWAKFFFGPFVTPGSHLLQFNSKDKDG
jgi:hypothetical protein